MSHQGDRIFIVVLEIQLPYLFILVVVAHIILIKFQVYHLIFEEEGRAVYQLNCLGYKFLTFFHLQFVLFLYYRVKFAFDKISKK